MKAFARTLLLACLAGIVITLTSCDILGKDEQAWNSQSAAFHQASMARHEAHAQRMAAYRGVNLSFAPHSVQEVSRE